MDRSSPWSSQTFCAGYLGEGSGVVGEAFGS